MATCLKMLKTNKEHIKWFFDSLNSVIQVSSEDFYSIKAVNNIFANPKLGSCCNIYKLLNIQRMMLVSMA